MFGIFLWELFSRLVPYSDYIDTDLVSQVKSGKLRPFKLEDEQKCPKTIMELMEECWSQESSKRPSMHDVAERLKHILHYKTFYQTMPNENQVQNFISSLPTKLTGTEKNSLSMKLKLTLI